MPISIPSAINFATYHGLETVEAQRGGMVLARGSYYQGFMLSQKEGCGEDLGENGSKSPTSKISTTRASLYLMWLLYSLDPEGRQNNGGANAPGAFLVFWWSLAPDLWFSLGQTTTCCKLSVNVHIYC